jgi:hypothetical protein
VNDTPLAVFAPAKITQPSVTAVAARESLFKFSLNLIAPSCKLIFEFAFYLLLYTPVSRF